MFIDSADIFVASGNGGAGAVSFRREKFVIQGGPDGGDGGKGGDVIIEVDTNADTLSNFRGKKHYKAQHGEPGKSRRCTGKNGADMIIKVPIGTQIFDYDSGELLADLDSIQSRITLLLGGKGGLGNARFKNARNQAPTYAQKGISGMSLHLRLELKLIADVGLVGYPNVGKSSLISTLSNAKPEVADYAFTTLTPHLGVVEVNDLDAFVMADIPGIIDGASSGKGLGLEFLKHIERTKILLFVLDGLRNLTEQYNALRFELAHFSTELAARAFGIAVSKVDVIEEPRAILRDFVDSLCATYTINLVESSTNLLYERQKAYEIKTHNNSANDSTSLVSSAPIDSSAVESSTPESTIMDFRSVDSMHATQHAKQIESAQLESNAPIQPLFVIGISSVAHTNTKTLAFLLHKALESSTDTQASQPLH